MGRAVVTRCLDPSFAIEGSHHCLLRKVHLVGVAVTNGSGLNHNLHMGDVHYLAGAMGIASWRARATLSEYAQAVDIPGSSLNKSQGGVVTGRPEHWSLNEVGVSDAVMASLWRHAPEGMTYVVSSQAESQFLGGDLAIVDGTLAIRVYQAKLVKDVDRSTNEYVLKSPLTHAHSFHLNTGTFDWDGQLHQKTGYLALYQRALPVAPGAREPRRSRWWLEAATSVGAPHLGGVYYWDMMAGGRGKPPRMASARGIMAAPVPPLPAQENVDRVEVLGSWPWEYGVANVWSGPASDSSSGAESEDTGSGADPGTERESAAVAAEGMPPPLVESVSPLSTDERQAFSNQLFRDLYGDRPATLTVIFV
jgi:hypothetical protein